MVSNPISHLDDQESIHVCGLGMPLFPCVWASLLIVWALLLTCLDFSSHAVGILFPCAWALLGLNPYVGGTITTIIINQSLITSLNYVGYMNFISSFLSQAKPQISCTSSYLLLSPSSRSSSAYPFPVVGL